MKFIKNKLILIAVLAIIFIASYASKSLKSKKSHKSQKSHHRSHHKKGRQVHIVRDMNGFNSDIGHVVRRSPSITTNTRLGAYRLPSPSNSIQISNSNTSNGPNVGNLGTNPTIVGPHIVYRSKNPISVVKDTPAHIGYRNEEKTLTSLNTETGKVESHTMNEKVPIYGNIQEVKTVYRTDERSYDLGEKKNGATQTTISDS